LLREIARKEGLVYAAEYPKKAMQFGTGISKLSNKYNFASNRQAKGHSNYILSSSRGEALN
jgi:hypothetical protein